MHLEATDWVYVPPAQRESPTGLGHVVEPASTHDDGTLATARVRFAGLPGDGHVWSVSNLQRVLPAEELEVAVAAWIHRALDDDALRQSLDAWDACNEERLRSPGVLTRLWEQRTPALTTRFAAYEPSPPWLARWLRAVGHHAHPLLDLAWSAAGSSFADAADIAHGTWEASEDSAELDEPLDLDAAPALEFDDDSDGPQDAASQPGAGEPFVIFLTGDPADPCFSIRHGERSTELLYPGPERDAPLGLGSLPGLAMLDLARRGATRLGTRHVMRRLMATLRRALESLGVELEFDYAASGYDYVLQGLVLVAGPGLPAQRRPAQPPEPTDEAPNRLAARLGVPPDTFDEAVRRWTALELRPLKPWWDTRIPSPPLPE